MPGQGTAPGVQSQPAKEAAGNRASAWEVLAVQRGLHPVTRKSIQNLLYSCIPPLQGDRVMRSHAQHHLHYPSLLHLVLAVFSQVSHGSGLLSQMLVFFLSSTGWEEAGVTWGARMGKGSGVSPVSGRYQQCRGQGWGCPALQKLEPAAP